MWRVRRKHPNRHHQNGGVGRRREDETEQTKPWPDGPNGRRTAGAADETRNGGERDVGRRPAAVSSSLDGTHTERARAGHSVPVSQ
jgi:hypothetical protein